MRDRRCVIGDRKLAWGKERWVSETGTLVVGDMGLGSIETGCGYRVEGILLIHNLIESPIFYIAWDM